MNIDRFRIIVVSRILILCVMLFLFVYLLMNTKLLMLTIMVGIAILYQIYSLIHFVERTNRELHRFFQSIQYDDFTQTFTGKSFGKSFDNLKNSFNQITLRFLKLRSEKEEQFRYLQTVIKHIGIGLISYKSNGDVELFNQAAKRLLNISHLKNIKSLEQFSKPMVETLHHLKSGENVLLKSESNGNNMCISIQATEFILKGECYTLVSLQDIQSEIEREHMAKELEIAWNVQKSLLPARNPHIPGFDIFGMCKPAEEVGGDYYDFIPLGKHKIGMIVGDVSGKGISASFYMTLTKGFIQSHMNENTSPKELLIKVNELMTETIDRKSFVTIFIAILDWESRKITCARAGHNPAIYYSTGSGKCVSIKPDGIALGWRDTETFSKNIREHQLHMHDHDWFIMYTDGFIETQDAKNKQFGENGLIEVLKENEQKDAQQMVGIIYDRVMNYSHSPQQHDDMTIIGIKTLTKSSGEPRPSA